MTLWNSIRHWWKAVIEIITVKVTYCDFLFGIANPNDDIMIDILNSCIMCGKWYIYKCKQNNLQLSLYTDGKKQIRDRADHL